MHGIGAKDGNRNVDWGQTSRDYSRFRPVYPASLFERLETHGIGRPGARVLDLATGVGFLAVEWAQRGGRVTGVDVAEGQLREAARRAGEAGVDVDWVHAPVQDLEYPDASFDLVTAGQCWLYFDHAVMAPRVARWLGADGRFVAVHFSWLAREDAVARASEELVLRFNPDWSAADWSGRIPDVLAGTRDDFRVESVFWYDEAVPFTHETWRGRIRASRGVGAALAPQEVAAFDAEHARLLEELVPDEFTVLHRIDAHVLAPRRETH